MQQFQYIAAVFVFAGIASAIVIAADLRSCPQRMRIMRSVWILKGLWATLIGLKAYFAFGRPKRCSEGYSAQAESTTPETAAPETPGTERPAEEPLRPEMHAAGTQELSAVQEIQTHEMHAAAGSQPMQTHEMHTAAGSQPMQTHEMHTAAGSQSMRAQEMHTAAGSQPMQTHEMHTAAGSQSMRAQEMPAVQTMPGMESMRRTEEMRGMRGMQGMEDMQGMQGMEMAGAMEARPRWQSVVLSTLHCGAGCTLADLVGEWFLFFVPVSVAGSLIAGTWIVDYLLALLFGIGFQYAAIREMEPRTSAKEVLRRAAKADILSLTAWQAGMYGWMALVIFVFNGGAPLARTTFGFWFMMQIAMACGFAVSLPVNLFLIRRGIKHGM